MAVRVIRLRLILARVSGGYDVLTQRVFCEQGQQPGAVLFLPDGTIVYVYWDDALLRDRWPEIEANVRMAALVM